MHSYEREREMLLGMVFKLQQRLDAMQKQLDRLAATARAPTLSSPTSACMPPKAPAKSFPTSLVVPARKPDTTEQCEPCSDVNYSEVVDLPPLEANERELYAAHSSGTKAVAQLPPPSYASQSAPFTAKSKNMASNKYLRLPAVADSAARGLHVACKGEHHHERARCSTTTIYKTIRVSDFPITHRIGISAPAADLREHTPRLHIDRNTRLQTTEGASDLELEGEITGYNLAPGSGRKRICHRYPPHYFRARENISTTSRRQGHRPDIQRIPRLPEHRDADRRPRPALRRDIRKNS